MGKRHRSFRFPQARILLSLGPSPDELDGIFFGIFGGIYRLANLVQNDSDPVTPLCERSRTISLEPSFDNKRLNHGPRKLKLTNLHPFMTWPHILR